MNHIAVVYWSGTGNTEQMAQAVLEGAKESGASSECFSADEFDGTMMDNYDRIAFGCPAMGAEELEEGEFQPMFESCRLKLEGKKLLCLVPMAGAMENGSETGRISAKPTERFWFLKV